VGELRSQEHDLTVVRDPWGKIALDERTFEAWRPLHRPAPEIPVEEPARKSSDEGEDSGSS
jgi:hypothetical protein